LIPHLLFLQRDGSTQNDGLELCVDETIRGYWTCLSTSKNISKNLYGTLYVNTILFLIVFFYSIIGTFFSCVYVYCTETKQQGLPKVPVRRVPKTGANNRQNNVQDGANIVGGELYTKLKNHFKAYLEKICEVRLFIWADFN